MLGGGKWERQNKKLNGAYINIVSKKSSKTSKTNNGNNNTNVTVAILGTAILGKMVLKGGY